MMSSWGRAIRRVICCGPGADASENNDSNEPVYQSLEQLQQAQDTASTLRSVVEVVEEIRRILVPIADVPDRMRRLELNLHPLLVYRPEDSEYMDMLNGIRAAPAAQPPPLPHRSVWVIWLQERVDYGEPW